MKKQLNSGTYGESPISLYCTIAQHSQRELASMTGSKTRRLSILFEFMYTGKVCRKETMHCAKLASFVRWRGGVFGRGLFGSAIIAVLDHKRMFFDTNNCSYL